MRADFVPYVKGARHARSFTGRTHHGSGNTNGRLRMAYFAVALVRGAGGWSGSELDLDDVQDVAEIADLLRDLDDAADVALALIEQDDEYCGIVRVVGTDDPRVFVSDERARDVSRIAELLLDETDPEIVLAEDTDEDPEDLDDEDADEEPDEGHGAPDGAVPTGDADIVADLGTPAAQLVRLCESPRVLPADVLSAVCENAGCLDELENLREG